MNQITRLNVLRQKMKVWRRVLVILVEEESNKGSTVGMLKWRCELSYQMQTLI